MSIKWAIIVICLLAATFVGIGDGLKCYYGLGKTAGSEASVYEEKECEGNQNACLSVDCAGVHDGKTLKGCKYEPANVDLDKEKCRIESSFCNITGVRTNGKDCSLCRGELCNTDHIVTTTSTTTTTTRRTTTIRSTADETSDSGNGLTFHHPAAFWLLFAIGTGTVMIAVGHFWIF